MKTLWENRHLFMAWVWLALAIPAFIWWKEAIWFVIAMSLYANIESSLAAHAARKDNHGE